MTRLALVKAINVDATEITVEFLRRQEKLCALVITKCLFTLQSAIWQYLFFLLYCHPHVHAKISGPCYQQKHVTMTKV